MSPASSLYRLAGDVKEPTNFSQRVGKVARGVVVRLYFEKFPEFRAPATFKTL